MSGSHVNNEDYSDTLKDGIIFTWIFFLFILSWISVAVVGRFLDNLSFSTFGLNDKSTYHTFIIAVVIVAIEILTIYYFSCIGITIYDPYTSNNNNNSTICYSGIDRISQMTNIVMI